MELEMTQRERRYGFRITGTITAFGVLMVLTGQDTGFSLQGVMVVLFGLAVMYSLYATRNQAEPTQRQLSFYYDATIKAGIILSLVWAMIGMGAGVWVVMLLAYPELTFDSAWASIGRGRVKT